MSLAALFSRCSAKLFTQQTLVCLVDSAFVSRRSLLGCLHYRHAGFKDEKMHREAVNDEQKGTA
jgi:hypothetical protein